MYLSECLFRNVGPIESFDVSLPLSSDGTPQPVVLVGANGSGKTIVLSHIADALIEFAKAAYEDVVPSQQQLSSPYFRVLGGTNQRTGTEFGVALLEFAHQEQLLSYIDRTGQVEPASLESSLRDRFAAVKPSLAGNQPTKGVSPTDKKFLEAFFQRSAVCYFPSSRHERPHWLNREGVVDEPVFSFREKYVGRLDKPIVVESTVQQTKQWLLDVVLDSRADLGRDPTFSADTTGQVDRGGRVVIVDNRIDEKGLLMESRHNIDKLLAAILRDDTAHLVVGYRTEPHRLSIGSSQRAIIPSFDHLSAGQAVLFNTFATIIRYADRGDLQKSIRLHEIEGIVLIDEIESHLHAELQHDLLPSLLKLFPKVQFVVTSHSPLFLLGMEREYGRDGFLVLDMPNGNVISTERFSEFKTSFEYYRRTKAHEDEVRSALVAEAEPIVFTEGETDQVYIGAALTALGHSDLLEKVELRAVGRRTTSGTTGGGITGLNQIRAIAGNHPDFLNRKVLLLYDCDSNKPSEDVGLLSVRAIPKNESNSNIRKGIENLLPAHVFEDRFYCEKTKVGDYGEENTIRSLDKVALCRYVCEERKESSDFEAFGDVVAILEEFVGLNANEPGKAS